MDKNILIVIALGIIWIGLSIIGAFNKRIAGCDMVIVIILGLISSCEIVTTVIK